MSRFVSFLPYLSALLVAAVFLFFGWAAYRNEQIAPALAVSAFMLSCLNSIALFPIIGKTFFSTHTREFMPLEQYTEMKKGLQEVQQQSTNKKPVMEDEEEWNGKPEMLHPEEVREMADYSAMLTRQWEAKAKEKKQSKFGKPA